MYVDDQLACGSRGAVFTVEEPWSWGWGVVRERQRELAVSMPELWRIQKPRTVDHDLNPRQGGRSRLLINICPTDGIALREKSTFSPLTSRLDKR